MSEKDETTEPATMQAHIKSEGKKRKTKEASERETLAFFDKVYFMKGKVQVCPDIVETKVKLFNKVTPAKPPRPVDKPRDSQSSKQQRTPTAATEAPEGETVRDATEIQQRVEQLGNRISSENRDGIPQSQHAARNSLEPAQESQLAATSADRQKRNKEKKIKDPPSYVLDDKKLENKDTLSQMASENSEYLVLQQVRAALKKITGPDDSPVFIFHNQDLVVKDKTSKSEGEKDVLCFHATLGILVLEVKGTKTIEKYSRFDKATTQLLHAKTSIREEMGDLLEDDAVVLTIALPNLEPGYSKVIREEAQKRKELKLLSGVTAHTATKSGVPLTSETGAAKGDDAVTMEWDASPGGGPSSLPSTASSSLTSPADVTDNPSTSRKSGKRGKGSKDSGEGGGAQKVKTEHLEDHPEIRLLCWSTEDVFTEWVSQLQDYRATTSHAFKGSTEDERLDSFKRACIRLCSVAAIRPGQSVKDVADLHSRFLLTKEQLQVRDSQAELLHISGPPGSGKTLLLVERARRWLREGRSLALVVGTSVQDMLLRHLVLSVCGKDADHTNISTHNDAGELLSSLRDESKKDKTISVILDEVLDPLDRYVDLLDCVKEEKIRALWTADTRPLPQEVETELQDLKGITIHLSHCLRCPPSVMTWTNSIRREEESPLEPPPVPIIKELGVGVELISHFDHPQHSFWRTCPACREAVLTFFSNLGLLEASGESALSWRDVVVLTTLGEERQGISEWLRELGLPALSERSIPRDRSTVNVPLPGAALAPGIDADTEAARSRVMLGVDSKGEAALHVVWSADFRGLEKAVVMLWHEDWEDRDRDRQRQDLRDSRLLEHRKYWFQAASRCQGRLAAMVITPSPVLSLLPITRPRLDISAFKTTLLFYHKHSQNDLPFWQCDECGQALVQRLRSLGLPVFGSPAADFCKQTVVVLTGWSCDWSRVTRWLRGLGLPVVFFEPQQTTSIARFDPTEVEKWQPCVEAGTDVNGVPAIHVVRNVTDLVPPRSVVVLVHHDQDDSHPDHQSQERRESRRWSHGIFWKKAVSLCQENLVVMATTPSPLLSLLEPSAETSPRQQSA